jgi:hypothetical protein
MENQEKRSSRRSVLWRFQKQDRISHLTGEFPSRFAYFVDIFVVHNHSEIDIAEIVGVSASDGPEYPSRGYSFIGFQTSCYVPLYRVPLGAPRKERGGDFAIFERLRHNLRQSQLSIIRFRTLYRIFRAGKYRRFWVFCY